MQEMPSIDMVYQGLNALYHNPEPDSKEGASKWLGQLQKSIFAWKIADQLLHLKRDMESCYFGAQTLRTKIQFSFHELPHEAHSSLRDSMLNHLTQINEHTNSVIVTQLCLALADLLLQMTSWTTPVQDLIHKFGPKNETDTPHLWPLLEVLTVLPEELSSRTLRLGANRRSEVVKLFSASAGDVLLLLDLCLRISSTDRLVSVRLLRCFSSWVQLQVMTLPQLANCAILGHVFATLSNPQSSTLVHEAASDAVCALLQVVGEQKNEDDPSLPPHQRPHQHSVPTLTELRALEDSLVESIRNLEPMYHAAVADEDMEKALNYCRIFTEISEALLHHMLELSRNNNGTLHGGNLFNLLDLVLVGVGHHEYEVAEVTFGFWYKLSEELYHIDDDSRTVKFRTYIEQLIGALCRHCQMEPDYEGVLEDGEDFAGFRSRVSELVKDVVFIVGSASVFKHCFLSIRGQSQMPWEASEASLFIMQAVAKNIIPDENEVVPQVVDALLQVPDTAHVAVRHTTLLVLGELSEWIDKHPPVVEPVLRYVLRCINDPSLSVAAANALESLASMCRQHLTPHLAVLLQVVDLLTVLPVNTETAVRVVKGVTKVCSRLPPNQITEAALQLCKIHVEQLRNICQIEVDPKMQKGQRDPVYWLDRLASVFRNLHVNVPDGEPHPCQPVVTYVWSVLSQAFDRFQMDRRVMERCCRCLRFALRLIGQQSAPLLEPLVTQMVGLYASHKHSCFLYLASILVDEYGGVNDCVPGLISMLEALLPHAFGLLQLPQGFCEHPDTVDDLFRLFARFLQRTPSAFLRSPALVPIFDCALSAATLDHREANSSVMQYLAELVHVPRTREDKVPEELRLMVLDTLLRPKGVLFVGTLISSSIFSLSSYSLASVADVLLEFMQVDRVNVSDWLSQTLQNLPRQSASGCIAVRPEQLDEFRKQFLNSKSSTDLATALREFARLYR